MPFRSWETKSHQEMAGNNKGIKKLPEDWVWQPVKMGPAHTSYGRGSVGTILTESVYDCGFCRGTGERPRSSICPVCKGKGTIKMEPPVVMCAYCRGRGEDKPRTQITCSACKGAGVMAVKEPIDTCSHCRGTGKEPTNKLPCGSCRGSGVMTVASESDEGIGDTSPGRYGAFNATTPERESEDYPGWVQPPSGSERDALEIILENGRAGRCTVGKYMAVSATYAEMVCNSLAKKGLVRKGEGRIYYPTPKGKKAMGWMDKEGQDE